MEQLSKLLTAAEVAEELRVHESTVTRWYRDGHLKAIKLPGGTLRFRRSDLDALLSVGLPS